MMLYIVRHGQTDWNLAHRFQGSQDLPLNATGMHQAELLAKRLAHIRFDAIYSSPVVRAKDTAKAIATAQNFKLEDIRYDDRIREYSFGTWEGRKVAEVKSQDAKLWDVYRHCPSTFHVEGSEDFSLRYEEMQAFLRELRALGQEKNNILLVCHGIALSLLLCAIFDLSVDKCMMFAGKNASISAVKYEGDYPRLTVFDDVSHYEEI